MIFYGADEEGPRDDFSINEIYKEEEDFKSFYETEKEKSQDYNILNFKTNEINVESIKEKDENENENLMYQKTEEVTKVKESLEKKNKNEFKEPLKEPFKTNKVNSNLGRKKKSTIEEKERKHNKCSDDNIRRKCKHITISSAKDFINNQIAMREPLSQRILTLNQHQIFNATIIFNKNFLEKSLGDIFSEKISGRYSTLSPFHNKEVIYKLINSKNEETKNYFKKLFSLTFIQCLKHFRKSEIIEELKGMAHFEDVVDEIKKKNDGDDVYIKVLYQYFMDYENIISKKNPRKPKLIKEN